MSHIFLNGVQMDKKIEFELERICPLFVAERRQYAVPFDVQMRELGFKSAAFDRNTDLHSLTEDEYLWFLLNWA